MTCVCQIYPNPPEITNEMREASLALPVRKNTEYKEAYSAWVQACHMGQPVSVKHWLFYKFHEVALKISKMVS